MRGDAPIAVFSLVRKMSFYFVTAGRISEVGFEENVNDQYLNVHNIDIPTIYVEHES